VWVCTSQTGASWHSVPVRADRRPALTGLTSLEVSEVLSDGVSRTVLPHTHFLMSVRQPREPPGDKLQLQPRFKVRSYNSAAVSASACSPCCRCCCASWHESGSSSFCMSTLPRQCCVVVVTHAWQLSCQFRVVRCVTCTHLPALHITTSSTALHIIRIAGPASYLGFEARGVCHVLCQLTFAAVTCPCVTGWPHQCHGRTATGGAGLQESSDPKGGLQSSQSPTPPSSAGRLWSQERWGNLYTTLILS
jgi:hypothetical protein